MKLNVGRYEEFSLAQLVIFRRIMSSVSINAELSSDTFLIENN